MLLKINPMFTSQLLCVCLVFSFQLTNIDDLPFIQPTIPSIQPTIPSIQPNIPSIQPNIPSIQPNRQPNKYISIK